MENNIALQFFKKPSIIPCYFKFLFSPKKGLKPGEALPKITGKWEGIRIDPDHLKAYNDCCGLPDTGTIPPLYPHVIAAPVHTTMLSQKAFPLKMMGSIHQRNHILQHRPIGTNEQIDLYCTVETKRNVKKGLEFDIVTHINISGELVWESLSGIFIRGRFGEPDAPVEMGTIPTSPEAELKEEWFVPAGTGRRYGQITSDYNPIHMTPVSAKLFGFKRDIAHGMWTLANAVGKMPLNANGSPIRIDAAFKGPMYLNNNAKLHVLEYENGNKLDVYCGNNQRPILCADVKIAGTGDSL